MAWIEHEFEVDRNVAQGVGFEFWQKRSGVNAKSLSANMFGSTPGGWLTAKGTPAGLRALAEEAMVGVFQMLALEIAIGRHTGKEQHVRISDQASSWWYPLCVAIGTDDDRDRSYTPSAYALSPDATPNGNGQILVRYIQTVLFCDNNDVIDLRTFAGYDAAEDVDSGIGEEKAEQWFDSLVAKHGLEVKDPEIEWGPAYTVDPAEQKMIDDAVSRIREREAARS